MIFDATTIADLRRDPTACHALVALLGTTAKALANLRDDWSDKSRTDAPPSMLAVAQVMLASCSRLAEEAEDHAADLIAALVPGQVAVHKSRERRLEVELESTRTAADDLARELAEVRMELGAALVERDEARRGWACERAHDDDANLRELPIPDRLEDYRIAADDLFDEHEAARLFPDGWTP